MKNKLKKLLHKLLCLISDRFCKRKIMYNGITISDEIIKKLQAYQISPVRLDDSSHYYHSYNYTKSSLLDLKLKDHPAFSYFKLVDNFLFSSNKPKARDINKFIRKHYWKNYDIYNKDKYIEEFCNYVGYHEYVSSRYDFIGIEDVGLNRYGNHVEKLNIKNRYEMPLHVYKLTPELESTKKDRVIIVLNGILSTADNVVGLKDDDYSKSFGNKWMELGYTVYALQVSYCRPFFNTYGLLLSTQGMDISNILDLVRYIKNNELNHKELIVSGISHGGVLAEMAGILSSDISAVITDSSLGGSDGFTDCIFPAENTYMENKGFAYQPQFLALFKRSDLLKLLCPKKLIISVGAGDHGNEKYKTIFDVLDFYEKYKHSGNIDINIFYGFHEPNPENEEMLLTKLLSTSS